MQAHSGSWSSVTVPCRASSVSRIDDCSLDIFIPLTVHLRRLGGGGTQTRSRLISSLFSWPFYCQCDRVWARWRWVLCYIGGTGRPLSAGGGEIYTIYDSNYSSVELLYIQPWFSLRAFEVACSGL